MNFLQWFFSTIAILIAAYLLPGVTVTLLGAVVLSVVLAILNLFIKPIIHFFTLPITILTLGLFSLIINAFLVYLSAKIVPGFYISRFLDALWFSIIISLITSVFGMGMKKRG